MQVWLLVTLVLMPFASRAANSQVVVVLSENSSAYVGFAKLISKNLPATIQATIVDNPELSSREIAGAELIIAVGMKAAKLSYTQYNVPTLATMISRMNYEELLTQAAPKKAAGSFSAIFFEQSWERQIDFLNATLPKHPRIGLVYAADSPIDLALLRSSTGAGRKSLAASAVRSAEELFPTLEHVLDESDVLLAIPDTVIFSSSNIRNILLTSYRHHVPLIGLSQSYVNAGALCAIFSTQEQLARQAANTVTLFFQTRSLPPAQYPGEYTISLNRQVARSLDIEFPSEGTILGRITH